MTDCIVANNLRMFSVGSKWSWLGLWHRQAELLTDHTAQSVSDFLGRDFDNSTRELTFIEWSHAVRMMGWLSGSLPHIYLQAI